MGTINQSIGEYYAEAFTAEEQFGISMVSNWLSLIVFLWLVSLAFLIIRANPKANENRFMALLITCEGFKAAFHMKAITPGGPSWWYIDQYLWNFNTTFFISAQVCSVLMYICFPIYYRINQLSFLYKPIFQRHAWYVMPLLTIIFMSIATDLWVYEHYAWIVCSEIGAEPEVVSQWGTLIPSMQEAVDSVGNCPVIDEWAIEETPKFGFFMVAISPLISIIALIVMRTSMKQYENEENSDSSNRLTSRSLYIGFLGKVIGSMMFFITLFFIIPALNGGTLPNLGDSIILELENPRGLTVILTKYAWIFVGLMIPLPFAFEGMMFAHASLKDTVLGIDSKLRRTFVNSIYTGLGAVSFLVGSELMEAFLGYGAFGGILLGAGVLIIRKPILSSLDHFGNKIIPSEFTEAENAYLKSYSASGADGIITEAERRILVATAEALNIASERASELEGIIDLKEGKPELETALEPAVVQQWTDEAGHTWRKMDNETIMWWNGTSWQKV